MRDNEISHKGVIVGIDSDFTQVEIFRPSSCAECHARGICGMSGGRKKTVSVPTDAFAMRNVGDEVEVCMRMTMGMKAVWISYVVPLILIILVTGIMSYLEFSELVVGISAIFVVISYYCAIFALRKKLKNQFEFYIREK